MMQKEALFIYFNKIYFVETNRKFLIYGVALGLIALLFYAFLLNKKFFIF